jgi:hypothetical protein
MGKTQVPKLHLNIKPLSNPIQKVGYKQPNIRKARTPRSALWSGFPRTGNALYFYVRRHPLQPFGI